MGDIPDQPFPWAIYVHIKYCITFAIQGDTKFAVRAYDAGNSIWTGWNVIK